MNASSTQQPPFNLWLAAEQGGARRESGNSAEAWFHRLTPTQATCARAVGGATPGATPPSARRRGPTGGGSGPGFGCGPGVVAGAAAGGSAAPSLVVCVGASSPSCCKALSCRRDSGGRGAGGIGREEEEEGRKKAVPPFFVFLHQNCFNLQIPILQIFWETLIFLPVLPRSFLRSALRRPALSPPGGDPSLLPARQPDLCLARGPQPRPRRAPGCSRRDEHRDATGGGPLPGMASAATTESTW